MGEKKNKQLSPLHLPPSGLSAAELLNLCIFVKTTGWPADVRDSMTRCRWRGQDRGWLHISRQSSTLLRMWVPLPSYQVPSTLKREPKNHPGKREEVWGQIEAKKQMMRSFLTLDCHKPTDSSSADSKARSPCEASRGAALRRPGQRGHHCSCKEQPQANTEHCPRILSTATACKKQGQGAAPTLHSLGRAWAKQAEGLCPTAHCSCWALPYKISCGASSPGCPLR